MDQKINPDASNGSDSVRVLVVDSTRIYTQLLADALRRDPRLNVVATPQPADIEKSLRRSNIHVAVVSSHLEGDPLRGLTLLHQVRQLSPQTRSVMLLDSPRHQAAVDAFRAGARGVFSRDESLDMLCACVHQVHRGKIWANSAQISDAIDALASAPQVHAIDANGADLLSERELEVVRGVSEGLTNKEIAERLELSPHTIKNYLFRIFDKLGVSNRMELLSLTLAPPGQMNPKSRTVTRSTDYDSSGSSYELRMAEIYAQGHGVPQDYSTSYAWYLLADHFTAAMRDKVDAGKRRLAESMTTDQILEAQRAAKEKLIAVGSNPTKAPHAPRTSKLVDPELPLLR